MLAQARRRLAPALSVPRYYVGGLLRKLFSCPVPIWCQAISFKVLTTLLPLILLAVGVFGLVLRQPDPFDTVAGYLREFLPPAQGEQLVTMVFELQKASGALTFVGAVFFLFTVLTLLGTVRYVVGQAVGQDRHGNRSIPQGYAFDLRMALQVGLLFLLSFGLTFAVNTLSVQTTAWGRAAGLDPDTLQRGWAAVLRGVTLVVPWLLSVGMFAQLFFFVPRPKPPLRSALTGAAVTAVLFELAKNGFTFYARYLSGINRYSDGEGGLGSLGGIFGLILVLGFWVYLSALTLIIGAMTVALHEQRHHGRRSALRRLWRTVRPRRAARPAPPPSGTRGDGTPAGSPEAVPGGPVAPEATGGAPERPEPSEG
jgi:membrane protein